MRVVCVGDCAVDRYVNLNLDRAGGITLNFAVNLRRLLPAEHEVRVVSVVGVDVESHLVRKAVSDHGLIADLDQAMGATPVQYIDQRPDGEKVFFKYAEGVLGGYRLPSRRHGVVAQADVVVANVYQQAEPLFDSVMGIQTTGRRVVDFTDLGDYDPPMPLVEKYAGGIDLGFFGLKPEQEGLISAIQALSAKLGKLYVVTLGENGSVAFESGREHRCGVEPVAKVVDTTGAGDTFAAGFVSVWLTESDVSKALKVGAAEAAKAVQRIGAF